MIFQVITGLVVAQAMDLCIKVTGLSLNLPAVVLYIVCFA